MRADVDHHGVVRYQPRQQRPHFAMMLLEDCLEEMCEESGGDPTAVGRNGRPAGHAQAIFCFKRASSRSRNGIVLRNGVVGLIKTARSLVISPASTASMHTFSSVSAKRTNSGVLSNVPRYHKPRVQAKIEAIGLVEVSLPCWCRRKWRVTVPCAASASTVLPSGVINTEVIRPSEP